MNQFYNFEINLLNCKISSHIQFEKSNHILLSKFEYLFQIFELKLKLHSIQLRSD